MTRWLWTLALAWAWAWAGGCAEPALSVGRDAPRPAREVTDGGPADHEEHEEEEEREEEGHEEGEREEHEEEDGTTAPDQDAGAPSP